MIGKIISAVCVFLVSVMPFAPILHSSEVKTMIVPVAEQIYMITGEGGNIGLFIGTDGTFLIDDQFAPLTDQIVSAIKSAGGEFPRFLINTHYHGDHTGGNENLGQGGTLIFSHHNVRERLSTGTFIAAFNMKREPLAKDGLPVVTFSEDITFHLNGNTIRAIHLPRAHTDGDSFIYFKEANVIHAGDIFFNGLYPFIDVDHGGSVKGMIKAVDDILSMADDKTKIIPGHGPLGDKSQLTGYRQMLETVYERLSKLKKEGKTVQEAVAAKPLADLEETWGDGIFKGDSWIEIIYSGI